MFCWRVVNAQWAITTCEQLSFLQQSHRPSGLIQSLNGDISTCSLQWYKAEHILTVFSLLCQGCQSLYLFLCRKVFAFLVMLCWSLTVRLRCLKIGSCYHAKCMICDSPWGGDLSSSYLFMCLTCSLKSGSNPLWENTVQVTCKWN